VLWLERGGQEVRWKHIQPRATAIPSRLLPGGATTSVSIGLAFTPAAWRSHPAVEKAAGHSRQHQWRRLGVDGAAALDPGQVGMLAHAGLLAVLTNDERGTLSVQLLDYGSEHTDVFPPHHVANGARQVRTAWDLASDKPALLMCWFSGGGLDTEDPGMYVCVRRHAVRLMGPEGAGLGAEVAIVVMFSIIVALCCIGRCMHHGRMGRGLPMVRPGTMEEDPSRRRRRRGASQARLDELREQLAQIPMVPMQTSCPTPETTAQGATPNPSGDQGLDPDRDGAAGAAGERGLAVRHPSATSRSPISACPICQNEVVMRVALQRCGHTACRDCVQQLVERNHVCHICRGPIQGVLPVYI